MAKEIIDFIESNIKEEITLDKLSKEFCMSPFHFHRIFKKITGESLINYIKLRRLTLASFELIDTKRKIIDIAIDFGFESQSTFTRAFKKHFKTSPNKYRKEGTDKIMLVKTRLNLESIKKTNKLDYIIVELEELRLIGKSCITSRDDDKENATIPKIWDSLYSDLCNCSYIPKFHRCFDYHRTGKTENGITSIWNVFVGIDMADYIPDGFELEIIPASNYIVFTHRGELDKLGSTLKKIREEYIPQTDVKINNDYTLNVYGEKALGDFFRPGKVMTHFPYSRGSDRRILPDYSIDIYIPIQK